MNWMMKKRKNKGEKLMKKFAWMFLAVIALAGCQKEAKPEEEKEPIPQPSQGPYTLTLQASKGADTKALNLDTSGGKEHLNAYWGENETVAVYLSGSCLGTLNATADGTDNHNATLSGELENVQGVAADVTLTLLYPRAEWDYTGQDGSAPSPAGTLATKYDYATASVEVKSINGNEITVKSGANFQNQQSMYRFGFKVGGEVLSVKEFTLSSNHNKLVTSRSYIGGEWTSAYGNLTVTPAAATNELLYISLRNENTTTTEADQFSFYVIGADNALYTGSKNIPGEKLGNGEFISAKSVSVTKSDLSKSGTATVVW